MVGIVGRNVPEIKTVPVARIFLYGHRPFYLIAVRIQDIIPRLRIDLRQFAQIKACGHIVPAGDPGSLWCIETHGRVIPGGHAHLLSVAVMGQIFCIHCRHIVVNPISRKQLGNIHRTGIVPVLVAVRRAVVIAVPVV